MCGFPGAFDGPGGIRMVREADRKDFLRFSSKSDIMVPSDDHETKTVNDLNI